MIPLPPPYPVTFFVSKRVGRGEYWAKRLFPLSSATILSGGGEEDGRWKRECSRGWEDKKKKNGSGGGTLVSPSLSSADVVISYLGGMFLSEPDALWKITVTRQGLSLCAMMLHDPASFLAGIIF